MADKPKDFKEEDKKSQGELKRIKEERDEYLDGWKRAKADLANYRKDELKRFEQVVQFATEDIIYDLITVLDSFELALASMKEGDPSEKGIYLIKSKLEEILKRRGLTKIKISPGNKFDPAYHEAVLVVEEKGAKPGTIAEELEAGYQLHKKVIRAAKVKVFK